MTSQENQNKLPIRTGPIKYPYELLTDREFEELLYSIFKREIEIGKYTGKFDDVILMTGVGEQGRDCRLLFQGINVGLVQCKYSNNPTNKLDKPAVAREIIKFTLYYLQDKSIISDVNKFTYFFAVSSDFTGPAIDLLSDFNHKICVEKDFETWVNEILDKHRTLTLSVDTDELKTVLCSINVKRIIRVDLDNTLANYPELVFRFFPVLTVMPLDFAEGTIKHLVAVAEQLKLESSKIQDRFPTPIEAEKVPAGEYKEQLDYACSLLDTFMPKQAIHYLELVKERIWDKASSEDKYRLLTYKGLAYLLQNKEPEAAQMLLDAFIFNPDSPKATANAALGFLLLNNNERCCELANQALAKDPTLERAYSMLVLASPPDELFESLLEKIPEFYRNTSEVSMSLGSLAQKQSLLVEAERWFRVAIQADSLNHPELRGKLATLLLGKVPNEHISSLPGFINPYTALLSEVIELYDEAWDRISQTEIRRYRIEWLVNRAFAKALLGKNEEAKEDLDYALQEEPNAPDIIRNRAILAYQTGDLSKGAALFRRILDTDPRSDAKFWLAVILLEDDKLAEAEILAQEVAKFTNYSSLTWEANRLLIHISLRQKNLQKARNLVNVLQEQYVEHIGTIKLDATVSRYEGNLEKSKSLLKRASSLINSETDLATQYGLAQELYECSMFEDVAILLEKIVDKQINSSPVRQLVLCYYRSGNLEPALNICRELRNKNGPLLFVTEIETAIYEEIDDLALARQVCEEYLILYPKDLKILLRLAVISYRLKDFDALDYFLKGDIPFQEFSLPEQTQIVDLLLARGYTQKALHIMYEARRRFFENSLAHQFYIQNILFRISQDEKSNQWFDVKEVNVDVAVFITDNLGSHPRWIIIDSRNDTDVQRGELSPNHTIVLKLLGKQVGDCVEIPQGNFSEIICIREIKSKFIHALHESMELSTRLFTDTPWMWRFPVNSSTEEKMTAETFQPLFTVIDNRQTYIESAIQYYREGKIPIGALANLLSMNPIEVLGLLSGDPSTGIHCCLGNPVERQKGLSVIDSHTRFIMDITSLITLHQLDVADSVVAVYGKFGLVRKTIELIEHLLEAKWTYAKPHMMLGKEGGQYTRTFVTEEIIEYNRQFLERTLKWAEANCEILPCSAALSVRRDARQKLGEVIGDSFLETILVADNKKLILYSDDFVLRRVAENEYGVLGIWTQLVLLRLHADRSVSDDLYNQTSIKLACLHYHHTAINAHILVEATKMAGWRNTHPFYQVVEGLSGKHSDVASSLNVATEWGYQLWQQKLPDKQYTELVIKMINTITSHRNQNERIFILNRLKEIMRRRFYLAPLAISQIEEIISLWEGTHIL